jgi:hypothetical protein
MGHPCYVRKVCVSTYGPSAIMQEKALLSMFSTLYFELHPQYKVEVTHNGLPRHVLCISRLSNKVQFPHQPRARGFL